MRILVAEDEKKIARLIQKGLTEQGYAVDLCHRGDDALTMASTEPYDAVILDIMLPGRDGLSVLRQLREKKISVPVMFLTARGEVSERIEGLDLGADDYLAKPFAMDELIARLRALLRRVTGEKLSFYRIGDLTMNLVSREVTRNTRRVDLTTREFNLLEYFMRTPGQVFTRTQIHERVWEYHFDPGTNLVDVYIQRLRRKIDDGESAKLIQTVRGVGYCVKAAD
jgi:heavy metal response regulator